LGVFTVATAFLILYLASTQPIYYVKIQIRETSASKGLSHAPPEELPENFAGGAAGPG
jgi:hypothetical protein